MALGGKKKKKKTSSENMEKKFVNLLEVLRSQDDPDRLYAKASTYKGRLIWQSFGGKDGSDEENSTFYEIKSAFISEPFETAPEFVVNTIACNLLNPKAAEPLDLEE